MQVLVTGHLGYIGTCLVPRLLHAGFEVTGTDTDLYRRCTYGQLDERVPNLSRDIRDLSSSDLEGLEAVVHLAGLSNDPLGELNPRLTMEINHVATVNLAEMARAAGVRRFLFSSSCSNYGAAGEAEVTEDHPFNPVTAYGRSKVAAEQDLSALAASGFSPTYLRNATVYGYSPRMRFDLVLNNLLAWAVTSGRVLLKSRGLAWRPLVHVEDVADAFIACLCAPPEDVHDQAFNIGLSSENFRVVEIANRVVEHVPGSALDMVAGATADTRSYRVNCDRVASVLPAWRPRWNMDKGITSILEVYARIGLAEGDFEGPAYARVAHLKQLLNDGGLRCDLRFRPAA
ncbi:MAG: SDR family oxidoreductase [Lysobacterales bacterium]|jgi:nucleoside-diphosphate-sugar epimerase